MLTSLPNNKQIKIPLCFLSLSLVVWLLPYLVQGKDAYFTIHDNLDGEFVYYHLLKINRLLFGFDASTPVPQVMNGLPRVFFHSEFSFIRLLFLLLPSFWAYLVNEILVRVIGFAGMYLLLRDYVLGNDRVYANAVLASLFFFIPLYPLYGLSVAGQPLLLWAFLNLSHHRRVKLSFSIILFFPFYSHFALSAPFILTGLFLFGIYRFGQRIYRTKFFQGLVLLFFSFLAANWMTVRYFLSAHGLSHRSAWIAEKPDLIAAIGDFFHILFLNQYHSSSFIALPLYLMVLLAYLRDVSMRKILLHLFSIVILIAFFDALYPYVKYYAGNKIHFLISFQFNRFTFLIPLVWFMLMAYAVKALQKNSRILAVLLILQAVFILYANKEWAYNDVKLLVDHRWKKFNKMAPGFNEFYAPRLFAKIDSAIAKPKATYRVACVGMHPAVAQYNGFYTLGGYQNNYLLSYKNKFRQIIRRELDKNPRLKKYFDDWGSRCYVFSSEIYNHCRFSCTKYDTLSVRLDLDTDAMKKLGARYIFSTVPVRNARELNWKFINKFTDKESIRNIWLYQIRR